MELENVYNGSFKFYKVFSSKMKKESPERCEPPKNNKRQVIKEKHWKGGKWKTKTLRKICQSNNENKIIYF